MNLMERLIPITPGELLDQEFLQPLCVSQYRLAKAIDVSASRISEIVGPAEIERTVELEARPRSPLTKMSACTRVVETPHCSPRLIIVTMLRMLQLRPHDQGRAWPIQQCHAKMGWKSS